MERRIITTEVTEEDKGIEPRLRPQRLEEYIGQESNSFLKRFYDGDITAMLSEYIENDRLSDSEIEHLRSLLSTTKPGKGGRLHD